MNNIEIGSQVRLTSKFLRSTGQAKGGEGQSKWIVTGFSNAGAWAITNEPVYDLSLFTHDELEADPTLAFRRIAIANLETINRK